MIHFIPLCYRLSFSIYIIIQSGTWQVLSAAFAKWVSDIFFFFSFLSFFSLSEITSLIFSTELVTELTVLFDGDNVASTVVLGGSLFLSFDDLS